MMQDFSKQKKKLIEEIGVHFEKVHQIPPLAARINALMILCPKSGHTFEDIVETTQASKSSVSTNLNLLLQRGSVEYFTKTGERKRYFRASKNYLKITLQENESKLSEALTLLEKMTAFNCKHNKQKQKMHEEFGKLYKNYLESHCQNLRRTIEKMNQLEKSL